MENKMKRFLSLALVLVMVIAMFPASVLAVEAAGEYVGQTLYLKPNGWTVDGARFAAYFFGNGGDKWVSMTKVNDEYYSVEVPANYTSVVFCRMNPGTTENNWDNRWNQTVDLSLSESNCFVITSPWGDGSNENKATGYWTYAPTFEPTTLYFKNTENWTTPKAYIWNMDTNANTATWPGAAMTYVEDDIWSVTVPAGYHGIIFNNGGSTQTADLFVTTATTDLYDGTRWTSQTAATVDGVAYTTLTGALSAAQAGQTVKLEKNVSLTSLEVNADTTLDLNGKQVTASEIYAFGNVVDTVGGGSLVISADADIVMPTDNTYMPIYDSANGCYRFFEYEVSSVVATDVNIPNGVRFWFQILFTNNEAYKLLAESENANVALDIKVNWTGLEENLSCAILTENVKTYAKTAYDQMVSKGSVTCGIYLTVFGLDKLESGNVVTATPVLSSNTMVEGTDDALEYTKP